MNQKIKRMFNAFVQYLNFNKKTIIINIIIFLGVVTALLLIDLLTKQFLFEWKDGYGKHQNQGSDEYRYKNWLFGIRSVINEGLTATFLNTLPIGLIHFFNFIILFSCISFLLSLKSKWFAVFIGFIFAGTLGNMVDRFAFGAVRDIIFLPWADNGTFNFADVDAIFGTIGLIITLIVLLFKNDHGVWIRR